MDELAERVGALSPERRRLLEQRLAARPPEQEPPLRPRGGSGPAPLSTVQEAIWALDRRDPGTSIFNIPVHLRIRGPLRSGQLYWSLLEVVNRHDILSSVFRQQGDAVVQAPDSAAASVANVDLRGLDPAQQQRELERLKRDHRQHRFDLGVGTMLVATVVRLADEDHALLLTMHHIVADAWSTGVLARELAECCAAAGQQRPALVPDLPVQFADYAAWQRQTADARTEQEAYWRRRLAGLPPFSLAGAATGPVSLAHAAGAGPNSLAHAAGAGANSPAHTAGGEAAFQGESEPLVLGAELSRAVLDVARQMAVTPFSALLGGLLYTLGRVSGRQALVRCPLANRSQPEVRDLIGPFASPVLLGWQPVSDASFESVVAAVHAGVLAALEWPHMPSECNALSTVMFDLRKPAIEPMQAGELTIEPLDTQLGVARTAGLELFVEMAEGAELFGVVGYDARALSATAVRELAATFLEVLRFGTAEPARPLEQLAIQGAAPLQVRSPASISIAGSFTTGPIERPLRAWLQRLGIEASIRLAPYGPPLPALLSTGGPLADGQASARVLLLRLDDVLGASPARDLADLAAAVRQVVGAMPAPLLVVLCPGVERAAFEAELAAQLGSLPGVRLMRSEQLIARYRLDSGGSALGDAEGHVPYGPEVYAALATEAARLAFCAARPPLKAVAVDCDGVLWAGACGEDGPAGVGLGEEHLALQRMLREQAAAGRLVCLVSRNDPEDVAATFAAHPDIPLRPEDISAWQIGWQPKAEGLAALAQELGIAPESILYLDDDAVQVALVRQACPEALSVALPALTSDWPAFLDQLWPLDVLGGTDVDRRRGELYQIESERQRDRAASLKAFFAGLELEVDVAPAEAGQLPRLAQLSARTTQFNTTGAAPAEVETLAVSVRDRYGDYGLVGLAALRREPGRLVVEQLCLSCRALGRGVEHCLLAHLGRLALQAGLAEVEVRFAPARRNAPAAAFLASAGGVLEDGAYRFRAGTATQARFEPLSLSTPEAGEASASLEVRGPAPSELVADIASGPWTGQGIRQALDSWLRRPRPAELGPAEAPRTGLEEKLAGLCAEVLGLDCVGVSDDFFALGGDSLQAVQLLVCISDELGFELRLPELVEHTTVARLARHLDPTASPAPDDAGPEAAAGARLRVRGSVQSAAAGLVLAALPPALQSTARALLLLPQLLPGNGPRPLEWLTDEPRVERVTVETPAGHEAADLFLPARPGRYPGAVMFIGAGVLGRADPRGVHLSMSLARLGIATLCYASSRMQQVHPEDIDCLVAVFRHLQSLPEVDPSACGFFGVCLGAAYSLRAAAEPEIAEDVAFVSALAPYFSLRDVIQAVFSKRPVGAARGRQWEVFPYSYPWWLGMLLRGLAPAEQQAVKTALRECLPEPAGLSEGARAVFRLGSQPSEQEAAELVAALPAELLARFDHNSPAGNLDGLCCPVVLMHSTNDVELPYEESRKLAVALRGRTPLRYTEFTMFEHVDLRRPGRTTDYARELWKLVRHIRAFTALARSRR